MEHLKKQHINYKGIALDVGYDIGEVHRGVELLGINGFTAILEYQDNAMKNSFKYEEEKTDSVKNFL